MTAAAPTITVVLPAFNEAEFLETTVADVVEGLRARDAAFEVVVCENGSTDATLALAAGLADKYPEVTVETLARADYGKALHAGLRRARGDYIVNFDVDFYDLAFLDAAVERVGSSGPAIVVASKRGEGAQDDRPISRIVVTAGFALLLRLLFRLRVSDTHGMKAMRRATVAPIAATCRFGKDLFDTELILRAERTGLRVGEIPVTVAERRPARTSLLRRVSRTLFGLARLRVALWWDRP